MTLDPNASARLGWTLSAREVESDGARAAREGDGDGSLRCDERAPSGCSRAALSVSELGEQRDDEGADRVREVSPALARALFGDVAPWVGDFSNLAYEWRRLVAELVGTFLLVLVAAGAGVVGAVSGGAVTRLPAVVAPALMVMAVILAIGAVSGAHLNPVVSIAFALRREFP